MKIYTRTGDKGETSLFGGGRVHKDNIQVEAYGTVDEANAFLGEAIARMDKVIHKDMIDDLTLVQHELFDMGGDLAQGGKKRVYRIVSDMVTRLETLIDKYDAECSKITRFILPGGSSLSSALHVCRVVTRRAERRAVTLGLEQEINDEVGRYLNRLSDLFFTLARTVNVRDGIGDVEYRS